MLSESTPPDAVRTAVQAPPEDTVEQHFRELIARLRELRPNEDLAPLEKAFRFAAERHQGQKRASGEPYMVHPLLVTRQLADMHMDMTCLETGLLHDVVEDTAGDASRKSARISAKMWPAAWTASPN